MKGKINELPNIDTSKYNIDESGNVLRDRRMTDVELEKKAEDYQIEQMINLEDFDDYEKSYNRFENGVFNAYIAGAKEMQEENEKLKAQIEKMKCCHSCLSHKLNNLKNCQTCDGNYSNRELAEW